MKKIHFHYTSLSPDAAEMYKKYPIQYATPNSSGFDLRANSIIEYQNNMNHLHLKDENGLGDIDQFVLEPNCRCLVGTGIKVEFEQGFELQIRSRSGLALKNGIMVSNGIGTIDQDYTGEICVILFNSSNVPFVIKKSDRVCQAILCQVFHAQSIIESNSHVTQTRSDGGFGSTGKK